MGERENFLLSNGYYYGFYESEGKGIRLKENFKCLENELLEVLIIFLNMKDTDFLHYETKIIGFYENATVSRKKIKRKFTDNNDRDYLFKTQNATLLDNRIKIEIEKIYNKCRSNLKYINDNNKEYIKSKLKELNKYLLNNNTNDFKIENEIQNEKSFYEGNQKEITIEIKERNQEIIKIVKERDNYTCQSCNFKYENKIVECHHLTPIAIQNNSYEIKENDLITLCPTCHRLAHYLLNKNDKDYKNKDILLNELKAIKGKNYDI